MPEDRISLSQFGIRVNRDSSVSLVEQLARGLREAIQSGSLSAGQRLPKIREMADDLGVSYVVANRAVRRLADSGFLAVRRRKGIHVAPARERVWSGHALWVTHSVQSFYFSSRQNALIRGLSAANIRVTTLLLTSNRDAEILPQLRAALETMNISAVICCELIPGVIAECARRNVPLVSCANQTDAHLAGYVSVTNREALRTLAAHCRGLGVSRPALLTHMPQLGFEAESEFAANGLTVETILTTHAWRRGGEGILEQHEYLGYEAVARMIEEDRLPELLFVVDDYIARGCLSALLQAGIRIPQDMQFVMQGNRLNFPVFNRVFTRIEHDPEAIGQALSGLVIKVLDGAESSTLTKTIEARFVAGETTAVVKPGVPPRRRKYRSLPISSRRAALEEQSR